MDNDSRTESAGVMLLSDFRALFNERRDPAYLATRDILEHLHEMDDRPWPAFGKFSKPITSEGMARLLKPFKIKPGQINEINTRGYYLKDLKDAFDRYIPKKVPLTPIGEGDNLHTCINQDEARVTENANLHKVNQTNAGTDPPGGAPDKEVCRYASRKGGDISEDVSDVSFVIEGVLADERDTYLSADNVGLTGFLSLLFPKYGERVRDDARVYAAILQLNGRPVDGLRFAELLGRSVESITPALDELARRGLIKPKGVSWLTSSVILQGAGGEP
jgi:hypothetical protein